MRDENGNRKLKWISTGLPERGNKKKAQTMLQEFLVQYKDKDIIKNYADMPFSEYCDYWLNDKKQSIEISTLQGYEYRIAHIKNYFAARNTKLSKVNARDIKEFYSFLLENGNMSKYKRENGLSQRSVKEISLLLKAILRDAVLVGDIVKNPAENIAVPKKKKTNAKQDNFIDADDLKILMTEIKGHVLESLITVTLFYGLRRSEVLGLRWQAVDFGKNTITIEHTVVKVRSKIAKDNAKNESSVRTYPMPEYIRSMLVNVRQKQHENQKLFGTEYIVSDYIFTWPDGRCFSTDYVTKTFKKIVTRSEELSSELTFHDLRKSCVSMMLEDGYSVKEVQKWVGHADANTTLNIYAKVKESKKLYIGKNMEEKFRYAAN